MDKDLIKKLNTICKEISDIKGISDAWIDDDCAYEGGIRIQISCDDEYIDDFAKLFGYN